MRQKKTDKISSRKQRKEGSLLNSVETD